MEVNGDVKAGAAPEEAYAVSPLERRLACCSGLSVPSFPHVGWIERILARNVPSGVRNVVEMLNMLWSVAETMRYWLSRHTDPVGRISDKRSSCARALIQLRPVSQRTGQSSRLAYCCR